MLNKIIKKIQEKINKIESAENLENRTDKIILLDPDALAGSPTSPMELDLRVIGLFSDVEQEKVAEICQSLIYMNEANKIQEDEEDKKSIEFYICTYGGSADDMFALYDLMSVVKEDTEIHTIGLGKVMSAGVLLLAAGTKGKRKNCRVMIHNVMGGTAGSLPNLTNELEAIQQLQDDYVAALVENTKLSKKKLTRMLNEKVNVYLSAEEAIEHGIADIII